MSEATLKTARHGVNRVALAAAVLVGAAGFFTTGDKSRVLLLAIGALGLLATLVLGRRSR